MFDTWIVLQEDLIEGLRVYFILTMIGKLKMEDN